LYSEERVISVEGFIMVGTSHPQQLPYTQVGYREQALCYILVLWQPVIIPVCVKLKILEYSGGYYIILYGDSSKCTHIKMVSGIIHIEERVLSVEAI
jgi:hypothetical protein